MSKKKQNTSFTSSNGFSSGTPTVTVRNEQPWVQQNQLSKTTRDPQQIKQVSEERRRMIQNFLGKNLKKFFSSSIETEKDDLDLKTTMNLKKVTFENSRPKTSYDPFDQRYRMGAITLEVDDELRNDNFMEKIQPDFRKKVPPGVLTLKSFNYGNVYREPLKIKKDPIIIIQSLVRRYLVKKHFNEKKNQLKNLLYDYRMGKTVQKMVQHDQQQTEELFMHLERQKRQFSESFSPFNTGKLGISKDNPFFNTAIEIMAERGMLTQDDLTNNKQPKAALQDPIKIKLQLLSSSATNKQQKNTTTKLRPGQKLIKPKIFDITSKPDENTIWKAVERKSITKKVKITPDMEEDNDEIIVREIKFNTIQPQLTRQQLLQQQKQEDKKIKIQQIIQKEVPPEPKVIKQKKQISASIDESIVGEDIEDIASVSAGIVEENIPEDVVDEQSINEYLEEDFEEDQSLRSVIKESISAQKESIVKESISGIKESIQEEYGDDFEEASQSIHTRKLISNKNKQEISVPEEDYGEEGFESYSGEQQTSKKKSVTFDNSAPKLSIQPLIDKIDKISQFGLIPNSPKTIETQPIKFIKPKWQEEDEKSYIHARNEAEYILNSVKEKYAELRKLTFDDPAFDDLKKEHYDLRRMQAQVGGLLKSTSMYWKDFQTEIKIKQEDMPAPQSSKADLLYSKFQFEFHRLLTVNSFGAKFQNILGKFGLGQGGNSSGGQMNSAQIGTLHTVLSSIEQQQFIVQQVLQSVLAQLQGLFAERETVNELKLMRQGMDQKIQQLIFKQDELLNDRLEAQLEKRDKELKKFIQDLFDKQKSHAVKLLPSQKLQEALQKSFTVFKDFQVDQSQSLANKLELQKKDSQRSLQKDDSSFYQPDFEEGSEMGSRIKTETEYEKDQFQQSSLSKDTLGSSMSMDHEVNEYESYPEIDWQNDINLFEKYDKLNINDIYRKESSSKPIQQTQELVDQITKLLLEEIKNDLFPSRQEPKQIEAPIPKKPQEPKQKVEPQIIEKEKPVPQKPQPVLNKKPPQEEEDDFGMGGPLFKRSDLEKEFDLSGDIQEDSTKDKESEDQKKPDLKSDPTYQKFVGQILTKYINELKKIKNKVINKFIDTVEEAKSKEFSLGGLLQRDFHFFRQSEIREPEAFQIVNSLEEQLNVMMLRVYNENQILSTLDIRRLLETRYENCLKQAQKAVQKIVEKIIPINYYPEKKQDFESVFKQTQKQIVPKECPQNFEAQDFSINQENEQIMEELHKKILKCLLIETLEDFNKVQEKKQKKK